MITGPSSLSRSFLTGLIFPLVLSLHNPLGSLHLQSSSLIIFQRIPQKSPVHSTPDFYTVNINHSKKSNYWSHLWRRCMIHTNTHTTPPLLPDVFCLTRPDYRLLSLHSFFFNDKICYQISLNLDGSYTYSKTKKWQSKFFFKLNLKLIKKREKSFWKDNTSDDIIKCEIIMWHYNMTLLNRPKSKKF